MDKSPPAPPKAHRRHRWCAQADPGTTPPSEMELGCRLGRHGACCYGGAGRTPRSAKTAPSLDPLAPSWPSSCAGVGGHGLHGQGPRRLWPQQRPQRRQAYPAVRRGPLLQAATTKGKVGKRPPKVARAAATPAVDPQAGGSPPAGLLVPQRPGPWFTMGHKFLARTAPLPAL